MMVYSFLKNYRYIVLTHDIVFSERCTMEETLKLILDKLNSMDSNIKELKNEVKTIGNQVPKIEN